MSKYRFFSLLIFLLALIGAILLYKFQYSTSFAIGYFIALFLIYSIGCALGAYFIQFNFFVTSINKGKGNAKTLALTFDDGPHENSLAILSILKKYELKACFFIIGKNIAGNEEIVRTMVADGHLLGNHSFEHSFWYSMKSVHHLVRDIHLNNQCLKAFTGKPIKWFRPPYGVTNPGIAAAIKQSQMTSIGWSIRSYDTKAEATAVTMNRIVSQLSTTDILLLHDRVESTAQLLEELILYCKKNEIAIVPLNELIELNAYEEVYQN